MIVWMLVAWADIAPGRWVPSHPCDGRAEGAACQTSDGAYGTCLDRAPPSANPSGPFGGVGWIGRRCVPDDPVLRARFLGGTEPSGAAGAAAPPAPPAEPPAPPPPPAASPALDPVAPAAPPTGTAAGCGCAGAPGGGWLVGVAALLARRRR